MKVPYFACRNCDFETEREELAEEHIEKTYTALNQWHTIGVVAQTITVVEVLQRRKMKERKW